MSDHTYVAYTNLLVAAQAAEIERLREEVARLRDALKPFDADPASVMEGGITLPDAPA